MVSSDEIKRIRAFYNPEEWHALAEKMGTSSLIHVGITDTLMRLCDEIERLHHIIEDDWK